MHKSCNTVARPERPNIRRPIALLITVYNRQAKLERALASVEPEHALLDIVIVDDGSTPPINTAHLAHYRIHVIRLPENSGAMTASNAGLEYIYQRRYEFIARLDSDDVAINHRFAKQLAFMRQHPDIGLLGSHFHIVNPDGEVQFHSQRPLGDKAIRRGMRLGCMLHHPTLLIRTSVAVQVGFYDDSFVAGGDYEYIWRVMNATKVANYPEALIRYEQGADDSLSVSRRYTQALNTLKVMLRNFDILSIFSYFGLAMSVVYLTNTVSFIHILKRPTIRLLLGSASTIPNPEIGASES